MDGSPQTIGTRLAAGVAVIDVPVELDLARAEEMRAAREKAVALGVPVVVNLADCDFIDSTGVGLVISAFREASEVGVPFALAGSGPQVRHVLELVGVHAVVPYFTSLPAAMEHVRAQK
jgi:anti-sigma B factor antagonist